MTTVAFIVPNSAAIPRKSGIYEICTTNGRYKYIGSTVDLNKRYRNHLRKLYKGNHPNKKLQKIFHKSRRILYFRVHVICCSTALVRIEQSYLSNAKGQLLNNTKKVGGHTGRIK